MTSSDAKIFDATKEIVLALIEKNAIPYNTFEDTNTTVEATAKAFNFIYNEISKSIK